MTVKNSSAITLTILAAGCVNVAWADAIADAQIFPACGSTYGTKLESRVFTMPRIGVETVAEIGQTMISTYKTDVMAGTESYAFSLDQSVQLSGRSYGQDFTLTLFPLKVAMTPGVAYRAADYNFQYANDKEPRTGLGKPDVYLTMILPSQEVTVKVKIGLGQEIFPIGNAEILKTTQCTITGPESFQRELVYSGVVKGVVSVSYREFIGNMARPAFSKEFQFDLSEGNEIGFKGARFKIVKANNLGITYQMTKNLD